MFDYSTENWQLLFEFKYGIPYVYDITIGDNIGDANEREYEITDHDADNPSLQELIDDYGISIEFSGDDYDLVGEMNIIFSLNEKSDEFLPFIKGIYRYISENFIYTDRHACYNYDSEDELDDIDIHLENELFDIDMTLEFSAMCERKFLQINITAKEEDLINYKSLNFWANRQNNKFCNFIDRIIEIKYKEKSLPNNLLSFVNIDDSLSENT